MEIVAFAVGALGLGYGLWSRWYLWRFAEEARGTRVAVAYKQKVKLDAPLTEWMLWARQASRDPGRGGPGRMVYSGGHTSVIVVQRVKRRIVWKMKWNRWRGKTPPAPRQATVADGSSQTSSRRATTSGAPTSTGRTGS